MFYRLSCAAVIVFWVVMTTMLVIRSYYWGEDRLPLVRDPNTVIERFVSNPNSSTLNVYRNEEQVGSLSISPRQLKNGNTEFLMTALGVMDFPGMQKQDVAWRGELELNPKQEVIGFELTVKFRNPRLNISLVFDPKSYELKYRVEEDGEVLVDSSDRNSKAVKKVKFMLSALGLSPKALERKERRNQSLAKDKIVARFGKVVIGGERQVAYILYIDSKRGGKPLKLYFSETGELLKVGKVTDRPGGDDSVMGYTVLSQGFKYLQGEKGEAR